MLVKNILYTCVGGEKGNEYSDMSVLLIKSINYNIRQKNRKERQIHKKDNEFKKNTLKKIDFVFIIIADHYQYSYISSKISQLRKRNKIHFPIIVKQVHLTDPFMLKLCIFDILPPKNKYKYNALLYIDADILCGEHFDISHFIQKSCQSFLESENNHIHALSESFDTVENMHKLSYFSVNEYNQETLDYFTKENIYPFNTGLFSISASQEMDFNFHNIIESMTQDKQAGKSAFTEQSYMNQFFCVKNLIKYDRITSQDCVLFVRPNQCFENNTLLHFCGEIGQNQKKLQFITDFIKQHTSKQFSKHLLS